MNRFKRKYIEPSFVMIEVDASIAVATISAPPTDTSGEEWGNSFNGSAQKKSIWNQTPSGSSSIWKNETTHLSTQSPFK
ncbi:MAG: hypothetical protein HUJ96_00535 [Marinilabiliaceae bacterium]|nr:hypothetical protein [Marinilabiliaceae bacterium]